jgi:hypothetical protein
MKNTFISSVILWLITFSTFNFSLAANQNRSIHTNFKDSSLKVDGKIDFEQQKITLKEHSSELIKLRKQLTNVESKLTSSELKYDSLLQKNLLINQNLNTISKELGLKIDTTTSVTKTQIEKIDNSLQTNSIYWVTGSVLIVLLGSFMFLQINKSIKSNKSDIETQILKTKTALEEESLKLDGQLVKILEQQIELIREKGNESSAEDHSLVLKIADRLTAMETNHYRMDPNTKGLKQLKSAVKSIKENYLAKGYEIVEMLELEYNEGMNVTANFIPSDSIEVGKRIITRVIKPQVNYNGKMIQSAQIEVSIGE